VGGSGIPGAMGALVHEIEVPVFFKGRDLLSLADLTDAEMSELVAFGRELKGRFHAGEPMDFLSGAQLFLLDPDNLFGGFNPLAIAMTQLGGIATLLEPSSPREKLGETWLDRARLMDLSGNGLAATGQGEDHGHAFMEELAEVLKAPLFNLMSDLAAPLQALSTLLTLHEHRGEKLEEARAAMLWAPPGQAQKSTALPLSLAEMFLRQGISLRMACPSRFHPGGEVAEYLDGFLPGGFELSEDPGEALDSADLVFSMNWTPEVGAEDIEELAAMGSEYSDWRMSSELLSLAAPEAILGGGLPQSRDNEIDGALLDDPRSIHAEESANLLHISKAMLALFMDPAIAGSVGEEHDSTIQ